MVILSSARSTTAIACCATYVLRILLLGMLTLTKLRGVPVVLKSLVQVGHFAEFSRPGAALILLLESFAFVDRDVDVRAWSVFWLGNGDVAHCGCEKIRVRIFDWCVVGIDVRRVYAERDMFDESCMIFEDVCRSIRLYRPCLFKNSVESLFLP